MFNAGFRFFIQNQWLELFVQLLKFVFIDFFFLFTLWLSKNTKKTPNLRGRLLFIDLLNISSNTFLSLFFFVRISITLEMLVRIFINLYFRRPTHDISLITRPPKFIIMLSNNPNLILILWLHFFFRRQHLNRTNMQTNALVIQQMDLIDIEFLKSLKIEHKLFRDNLCKPLDK